MPSEAIANIPKIISKIPRIEIGLISWKPHSTCQTVINLYLFIPGQFQAEPHVEQQGLDARHLPDVTLVGGGFFSRRLGSDHVVGDDQGTRSQLWIEEIEAGNVQFFPQV